MLELRQQLAEQAEAIDLQLHTNRRIAELEEKVAKWVEKAKNWTASPEAGKMLDGYRTLAAKCAELETERDKLRQQLTHTCDWFDAQAKSSSKGNLSAWDLMILREERDAINKVLRELK